MLPTRNDSGKGVNVPKTHLITNNDQNIMEKY